MFRIIFYCLLLVCFLCSAVTGFINAFGTRTEVIDRFHQTSGMLLVTFVFVHLFLNRHALKALFRSHPH